MPAAPAKAVEVFYSYAHKDEDLRNQLAEHLSSLRWQGYITEWYDRQIGAGTQWAQEIDAHLNTATIILLLISSSFLASDYCYGIEMQRALERHEAKEALVIPIILRSVDWQGTPFEKLQALPANGKPITTWPNQDEAFLDVTRGIRKAIEAWSTPFVSFPPTSFEGPYWNVPYRRNPFFTGREDVLSQLHTKLSTTGATALTQPQAVSGLGGIGKTQIAVEYAYRYRDEYQFILWTRAASRDTLISDFVTVADLLNLPGKGEQDQGKIVSAVRQWLATHEGWLLILDNADDLTLVPDFLPLGDRGHILLTTRAQAAGEIAQSIEIEQMGMAEGVLLLLRRIKALEADAFLDQASEEELAGAEAIVIEMDFLPLALDQAGAYIDETGCSLSSYLDLYREHCKDLLQRRGTLPSGHPESVATTWSLSFQKVEQANPAAADVLRWCAFLDPDAIPEELISEGASKFSPALRRIASDALGLNEAIEELRKFSLVRRNPDAKMLSIHRLVQAVLKDTMKRAAQRRWAEKVVRAVNSVFPDVNMTTSSQSLRFLPHVQVCATLITRWNLTFLEAAQLCNRAGRYLEEHAQYPQAETLLQQALATHEKVLGPEHPDTATSLNDLAMLYEKQGKYNQSETLFQRALAIREKVLGSEHPDTAISLNGLAWLFERLGKYKQAELLYKRALAIREKVLGPEHPDTATSLDDLAWLYDSQGEYKQAEPLLKRALAIREKVLGSEHPDTATSLNDLAGVYDSQGKYEQAEPLYQRALAIREKVLGSEHPDTAISLNNLAMLYMYRGEYEQAELRFERVLAIDQKAFGPEHAEVATDLNNLALLYTKQGKYEQAESLYQEALAIREREIGLEHPDTAISLHDLATLYTKQGKYEQAEPLYQKALAIDQKAFGPEHAEVATDLNNLALLYTKQGKYEQAESLYQKALAIREKVLGPEDPDTTESLNNLVQLYEREGKQKQAHLLMQRVLAIHEQLQRPQ